MTLTQALAIIAGQMVGTVAGIAVVVGASYSLSVLGEPSNAWLWNLILS